MKTGHPELHKIGQVAQIINVSVPTLRMYEREGLLIPIKSTGGTRYFSDRDVQWIRCIRRMITELGLNIEGIRRLLALIPCWELTGCQRPSAEKCPGLQDVSRPCWMKNNVPCKTSVDACHDCEAYQYSINCENLKSLFVIRLKQLSNNRHHPPQTKSRA